jgi:hypothetical protein
MAVSLMSKKRSYAKRNWYIMSPQLPLTSLLVPSMSLPIAYHCRSHWHPTPFVVLYVLCPIFMVNLLFLDCLDNNVGAVRSLEMSVTLCCLTQCYIPKNLDLLWTLLWESQIQCSLWTLKKEIIIFFLVFHWKKKVINKLFIKWGAGIFKKGMK